MKNLVIMVAAFFISTTVFSQELDLGIKLGSNFSSISDAQQRSSSRTGIQAGVFGGIKFNDKIGVNLDVLYSQQGADFDAGAFDLTYVNLPFVVKYYLVGGLHIQAGPQFGVLIDESLSETLTNEYKEIVESEISGIIGIGYDLPFGLRIDGRYNFGLTDISKPEVGNKGIKNSVFTVAVGFAFL
ncbi:PorT family protein [Flavobacteriaceae bacterium]|nr:PorT family protein [Flavobacteriaceae bacterium]